jgi:hypothetical protein
MLDKTVVSHRGGSGTYYPWNRDETHGEHGVCSRCADRCYHAASRAVILLACCRSMTQSIDRSARCVPWRKSWRSFFAVGRQSPQVGHESMLRFEERIKIIAALMQFQPASVFLHRTAEERQMLFDEFNAHRSPQIEVGSDVVRHFSPGDTFPTVVERNGRKDGRAFNHLRVAFRCVPALTNGQRAAVAPRCPVIFLNAITRR